MIWETILLIFPKCDSSPCDPASIGEMLIHYINVRALGLILLVTLGEKATAILDSLFLKQGCCALLLHPGVTGAVWHTFLSLPLLLDLTSSSHFDIPSLKGRSPFPVLISLAFTCWIYFLQMWVSWMQACSFLLREVFP